MLHGDPICDYKLFPLISVCETQLKVPEAVQLEWQASGRAVYPC